MENQTVKNNRINLCDSCKNVFPECNAKVGDILFGDGKGKDNICACSLYTPVFNERAIEDTEKSFPDRFLTDIDRKLLLAKIIRYTSTDISNTLPAEIRLEVKLKDSNIINLFVERGNKDTVRQIFISIGAHLRKVLTSNPELCLGMNIEKDIKIVSDIKNINLH